MFEEYNFFGFNNFGMYDIEEKFFVCFMRFYFDCGWLNKWVVFVVFLIIDFMLRYSNWIYLR